MTFALLTVSALWLIVLSRQTALAVLPCPLQQLVSICCHCRLMDIRKPGSANQDPIFTNNKLPDGEVGYPGGIFDPLGYSKGDLSTYKVKEIKNGRLAMLAFAGFVAQVSIGQGGAHGLHDSLTNGNGFVSMAQSLSNGII